ncbi:MAG: DUF4190 domain-containing protein [Anaerolineales bacterium]|nr:DUF4190 domain-containing protein [Anaerolineales bacterium]
MNSNAPQHVVVLPAPSPKVNGNAVTSMVLGILGWVIYIGMWCLNFLIGWVLLVATAGIGLLCLLPLGCISPLLWFIGIITGHSAQAQIRQRGEGGGGMATAGLWLNWLGIILTVVGSVIIAILLLTGVITMAALIPYLTAPYYY